jgi:CRP-like cAMP-binding protein
VIARQGHLAERCYYVCSGYAKVVSTSPTGHEILVGFVGPHGLIGQGATNLCVESYLVTTIANQRMELVAWTREAAQQLAEHFPEIQSRLDALMARNFRIVLNRLHTVSEGRVPRRLASALAELADRHGTVDAQGVAINPSVTREDLAALTGTSLYTVSRVLADWEHQGMLQTRRGRVRVTDIRRLRALARAGRVTRMPHCPIATTAGASTR